MQKFNQKSTQLLSFYKKFFGVRFCTTPIHIQSKEANSFLFKTSEKEFIGFYTNAQDDLIPFFIKGGQLSISHYTYEELHEEFKKLKAVLPYFTGDIYILFRKFFRPYLIKSDLYHYTVVNDIIAQKLENADD